MTKRSMGMVGLILWASAASAVDVPVMNAGTEDRLATARQAIADGAWRRAIAELQVVLRQSPDKADAHNLMGYALRKAQPPQLQEALAHYQTALRLNPLHKGAHEYIGEAYLMLGDLPRAQFHLAQLELICQGRSCEEYQDLADAIDKARAKGLR